MIFKETIKRKMDAFMKSHEDKLFMNLKSEMLFKIKSEMLKNTTSTCKDSGVTTDRIADKEVVLSLTTYSKRLFSVYLTIESIMQGTMKPNRLILWLEEELKDEPLPYSLRLQMKRGLEVRYTKDIRQYKKLIPTLKLCPNSVIVTIDDDVMYEVDTLDRLVGAYNKNPHYIYASRIRRIALNNDGAVEPYRKWKHVPNGTPPSNLNLAIGEAGILYPPGSLSAEVFDEDSFMKYCPTNDDLWFWLMAKKNGYVASKVYTHERYGHDTICMDEVQDIALFKTNLLANDTQFKSLVENCKAGDYLVE